jgi:type III restriction enzyme
VRGVRFHAHRGLGRQQVTHVLGVRALGTQLLREQVIGRALRRQSYELNEENRFNVEYADVLGVPFDFAAKPVVAPPQPPRQTIQVRAVRPERDALEIRFPRVQGYRVELPDERLQAKFSEDSVLALTPELTGPSNTLNSGIVGEGVNLTVQHLGDARSSTVLYRLTSHLMFTKWRDPGEEAKVHLFGQLKRITKEWLDHYLVCKGDTYPSQVLYRKIADMACERITAAITEETGENDLLNLVVEIKGYRREDAKDKKLTMETYWVPGVNNSGVFGRWAFAEFTEVYGLEADLTAKIGQEVNRIIGSTVANELPA